MTQKVYLLSQVYHHSLLFYPHPLLFYPPPIYLHHIYPHLLTLPGTTINNTSRKTIAFHPNLLN
jgi:hypothetical protein